MAVGVQKAWSVTASSNGNSDTNANWAEGMLAPSINNSARANMAAIKGWSNQISGGCTCAGSSNAYTITSDAAAAISTAYAAGMMFMLKANHTNSGAATLNVDGVGDVAITTSDGGDVVAGDIVSGGLYLLAYNSTGPRFDLIGTFAGGAFQPLDATLTAVAGLSFSTTNAFFRATDVDTFVAESASNFRSALGLGNLATVTPGTGVAAALAVNVGSAGAIVVNGGVLGTPSSGTLTNATGLPISSGVSGLGTNVATALGIAIGSAGAVVTSNSTDTLSNKTLDSVGPVSEYSLGYRGLPDKGALIASAYTFALVDAGKMSRVYHTGSSFAITIPPNSSVAFPLGTVLVVMMYPGTNGVTIAEGSGVILFRGDGVVATGTRTLSQYSLVALEKIDTNSWMITGAFT